MKVCCDDKMPIIVKHFISDHTYIRISPNFDHARTHQLIEYLINIGSYSRIVRSKCMDSPVSGFSVFVSLRICSMNLFVILRYHIYVLHWSIAFTMVFDSLYRLHCKRPYRHCEECYLPWNESLFCWVCL